MRLQPLRGSFTVLATFLVLAISFDSSPILPSVPAPSKLSRRAPDPRTNALVDALTGHGPTSPSGSAGPNGSAGPDGSNIGTDLQVIRRGDLDAALFRSTQGSEPWSGAEERGAELAVVRKLPFGRAIARAAERHQLDPLLLAAIVETESAFAPDAVSSEGAIGLMQLIPETGQQYGKTDLFDPYVNLEVGSEFIGALLDRYHGDLALALAAYNCGPGTVTRYGAVPPFRETRDFVKGVLALYVQHRQNAWKRSKESTDLLRSSMLSSGGGEGRGSGATASLWGARRGERSLLGRERRSFASLAAKSPKSPSLPTPPIAPIAQSASAR
jgi:hypothetical protein